MSDSPQISPRQAMIFLLGSLFSTLVLFFGSSFLWSKWKISRLSDPKSSIVALIQTGPEKEALSTSYLTEILNLSSDNPTPLYAFNLKHGVQRLLSCPLISEAKIKRIPPGALYVDYTVRKPIAWLSDYQNTGIDHEGFLFPVAPFFSPKNLPEIYLGLPPFGEEEDAQGRKGGCWQTPLGNKHLRLALDLLNLLCDAPWRQGVRIKRIDVSNAFAKSLGQREIVLFTEEELIKRSGEKETVYLFPKILRLAPKNYLQQLSNFFTLRQKIFEDYERQISEVSQSPQSLVQFTPRIIDLRIPQMAFVQNS